MSEEIKETPLYVKHFDAYAVEDLDHIRIICGTASANLHKDLHIKNLDYRMVGTIFSVIHSVFISVLQSLRDEGKNEVNINVGNRFAIGYTTKEDSDDEKQGNFMFYMRHIGANKKITEYEEGSTSYKDRAVQWNISNILKNPEVIQKISAKANEKLREYNIEIGTSELIMPMYCIVYDVIIEYLTIHRRELPLSENFEFEINFMSCFYIAARDSGKDSDVITIRPNIEAKLALKSDQQGSAKYE